MIPRISSTSVFFGANQQSSVRDLYDARLNTVSQTAQKQSINVTSSNFPVLPALTNPIPMQGTGQKLDVQA